MSLSAKTHEVIQSDPGVVVQGNSGTQPHGEKYQDVNLITTFMEVLSGVK